MAPCQPGMQRVWPAVERGNGFRRFDPARQAVRQEKALLRLTVRRGHQARLRAGQGRLTLSQRALHQ